jgi:hypothetical protein
MLSTVKAERGMFADLKRWRADLAAEIARRNGAPPPEATLRRLLLLRACEDRGVEPRAIAALLSESLELEREAIPAPVWSSRSALPVELLGAIHERERRPEARRSRGVYYTPRYIVNAIVERTLSPFTQEKSPEELAHLRVIDPACGSGVFLIAALDHIIKAHERFYGQLRRCPARYRGDFVVRAGVPRLTLRKKREILARSIHGVDVDEQAVEIARVSLYLRLLEGERDDPQKPQVDPQAPPSMPGVRRGDSLLDSDIDGAFHAVLGNPPYVRIQELNASHAVDLYKSRFRSARRGNFDAYALFVERALELIRPDGLVGFILPHKFFQAKYGAGLRALLAERSAVREIVDFGHAQVFEGATTYTCLFYLGGSPAPEILLRRIEDDEPLPNALTAALSRPAEAIPSSELARPTWNFRARGELSDRLYQTKPSLGEVCERIFQGLVTGADDVFFLEARGRALYSRALKAEVDVEPALLLPLVKGSAHIRRYGFDPTPLRALFPYRSENGRAELISTDQLRRCYPKAWAYLCSCREPLEARERSKWKGNERWYAYGRGQALGLVGRPKLLCPSIAKRSSFAVDASGALSFAGSGGGGGGGYGLLVRPGISMDYLCALLNSSLLEWLLRARATPFRGGYIASSRQYIEGLPIRLPRLDSPDGRAEHDELAELSRTVAELVRRRRATEQPEIDAAIFEAERAIDERVFSLYGLSSAERRQVRGEVIRGEVRL